MKLILVLAMLLGGCANMQRTEPMGYYSGGYGYSSGYSRAGPVRTYWLYDQGRLTPYMQNGPIIMRMPGF